MRPDLRNIVTPRLSGAVLDTNEVDYDDLIINRQWRSYDPTTPGEVRYFMYELSQRDPGSPDYWHGYKAVRFLRLTRVPRWLRQQSSGVGRPGFAQMAYVLSALREQRILFVQLVAKTPDMPLVFAYGVQSVASTIEEAQFRADEAYAALSGLLDGVFQQIEYAPITFDEGERLALHQSTWRNIAIARGRPIPNSEAVGAASILDGNRTDIEATHNQMEVFIRAMSEARRGFMLSLVSTPISPEDMTLAWRNISTQLSQVRSETHGAKAFTAGVAIPLAVGSSAGITNGDSHSTSASHGTGTSLGESFAHGTSESHTFTDGTSQSETAGVSHSLTDGTSQSYSQGVSQSASDGTSYSENLGLSETQTDSFSAGASTSESYTEGQSLSDSLSHSLSQGESISRGQSLTESVGTSEGLSHGVSSSESMGTSVGQSLGESRSASANWSESQSQALGASVTGTQGWSQSAGESHSQTVNLSQALGDSLSNGQSQSNGSSASAGLLGFGGSGTTTDGHSVTQGINSTNTFGLSESGGNSFSTSISDSLARGLSQTNTVGASQGGSLGQSLTATNSVGQNHTVGFGESLSSTRSSSHGMSAGETLSAGQSLSATDGVSRSVGASLSNGLTTGQNIGTGTSQGLSHSQGVSAGTTHTDTTGTSESVSAGRSTSATAGTSESVSAGTSKSHAAGTGTSDTATASAGSSQNQSLADAYMVAMSRQASTTGSLGVVPSMGISVTKQTLDSAKQVIGDILEATRNRYLDGLEGGAYLYQMFLVTEDRETLATASALLKASFWGPGTKTERLAQPFHVTSDFSEPGRDDDFAAAEEERLLRHAQAFTSYRRREPVIEIIEPYKYSSFITVSELSAFARPPVAESLGLLAVHDSAPVLAMPADRTDREVTLGMLFNGERARVSTTPFGVDAREITHTLVTGVTGAGKALALDTPIPTPTGWTTMGELRPGDLVLDDHGRPTLVSFATDTMVGHDCFEVRFSDGTTIVADAEHLWAVSSRNSRAAASKRRAGKANGRAARTFMAKAASLRLQAELNRGRELSLPEAAEEFDHVDYGRLAKLVAAAKVPPADVVERLCVQNYGDKVVKKRRHVKVYPAHVLLTLLADFYEATAATVAPSDEEFIVTTADLASDANVGVDQRRNFAVRVAAALELAEADLDIDPYLLGVWLGDGSSDGCRLYIHEDDIETVERIRARGYEVRRDHELTWTVIDPAFRDALDRARELYAEGFTLRSAALAAGANPLTAYQYAKRDNWEGKDGNTRAHAGPHPRPARKLHTQLRDLGVLGDKHIPTPYLRASKEQRLELLRGIMDSDGTVGARGTCVIAVTNRKLAEGVLELVRSLGIDAQWREGRATLNGRDCGPLYSVAFTTDLPVVTLARKASRLPVKVRETSRWRYITSVRPVPSVPVRCIQVESPSKLYLAGPSMVPTHNTTTLMKLLAELVKVERDVTLPGPDHDPLPRTQKVPASILGLDWMRNMRNLGSIVDPVRTDPTTGETTGRFQFFSVRSPELGAFRWNPLEVPAEGMNPSEWLQSMADNMVAAWNLGEFGRSLIAEFIDRLYTANRLEPFELRPERIDDAGNVLRTALVLDPIDPSQLPPDAVGVDHTTGEPVANVYTCPQLSRLVGVGHLAIIVASEIEAAATPEGGRLGGTAIRDRLQSLWRRVAYYAPGGQFSDIISHDTSLADRTCLSIGDLVDPRRGLVTVIETDGLDLANRRFILGSVMLSLYRSGLHAGEGCFDLNGNGPGLFVVLEEAHELFGAQGEDEDRVSASTRVALYESMHRRIRALGARLIDVVQNPGDIPEAITSNTSTVLVHRTYAEADRKRVFSLLNWSNMIGQQLREFRWLGEMPRGYVIARLDAKDNYLESAPIQFVTTPATLGQVTDKHLSVWARWRTGQR